MPQPKTPPAVRFNHEALLRAFDNSPATLQHILRMTGMDVPNEETIRNWLRRERREITTPWLPSVIAGLRKAGRIEWRDVFVRTGQSEDAA
jgi:hypothetical protein